MAVTDRLFDPQVVDEPYEYYAQLRRSDPVHEIEGANTFLVTRLDLIHQVVADTETFSNVSNAFLYVSPDGTAGLRSSFGGEPEDSMGESGVVSTVDPPDHGRQRRVMSRVLSRAVIDRREDEARELIDRALDEPLRAGKVEWMSAIAEPLPAVLVARILGLDDAIAPFLKDTGFAGVEQIGGFVTAERNEELRDLMVRLGPVAEAYQQARQGEVKPGADTVLEACLEAVQAGEINDAEAFGTLILIVSAGTESTTSLLGAGARVLAERPELQEALRGDPTLIPTFVEEVCRLEPPFRGHYRRATRATVLDGVAIPANARLVLVWPAANRDPSGFDEPEEIRLDRPAPRQHVGFGWGIHLCVGAPLARLEARVTFQRLLERTNAITIDPAAGQLAHHKSLMIRRLMALPLLLDPSAS